MLVVVFVVPLRNERTAIISKVDDDASVAVVDDDGDVPALTELQLSLLFIVPFTTLCGSLFSGDQKL